MNDDKITPWRATAIDMAAKNAAWDDHTYSVEAVENLLMGVVCGLLDVADAVRELRHQPDALTALTDAAPTAEAVALLLRAHQQQPTTTTTKGNH